MIKIIINVSEDNSSAKMLMDKPSNNAMAMAYFKLAELQAEIQHAMKQANKNSIKRIVVDGEDKSKK